MFLTELFEGTDDVISAMGAEKANKLFAHKVDSNIQAQHDKVFGTGTMQVEIPLANSEIPQDVENFVSSKGSKVSKNNTVVLPNGREVEVTKFLGKAKAPIDVVTSYSNYARNKANDVKLVISRAPGDVASASTGTSWQSCANLKLTTSNPAAKAMKNELIYGTMIAMLLQVDAVVTQHGDYASKDMIGRVLIKPFLNANDHITFSPLRSYGKWTAEASAAVVTFVKKYYPMKSTSYDIHPKVYNDAAEPLRVDGPEKDRNGDIRWYKNGRLHREDGPAIKRKNGTKEWYLNGRRERSSGPAVTYSDGSEEWYQNGQLSRDDGPAVIERDGSKIICQKWYKNGVQHRTDGPAVERANKNSTSNVVSSDEWWVNGKLHRKDGPAIVYSDTSTRWYLNGERHRTDGPAIEYADGTKEWYLNDKIHRIGGPAVINSQGREEWWVDGKRVKNPNLKKGKI